MLFSYFVYLVYLIIVVLICRALGRRIEKRFGLNIWLGTILVFGTFLGSGAVAAWFFDSIDKVTSNIELPVILILWIIEIAVGVYGSHINKRSYFKGFLLGFFLGPLGAILSLTSLPKNQCKECGKNLGEDFQVCPYCRAEVTQATASIPTRKSRR